MPERDRDVDVLILRPRDGQIWGFNPLLESMGAGYLAAVLRGAGARAEILDNYFENLDEKALLAAILQRRFKLLAVSISHQYPNMWPLFEMLREFKIARPDVPVVAGGQFPSFAWASLLKLGVFDAIAIGEGEDVIVQLYRSVSNKSSFHAVDSLVFVEGGRVVQTKRGKMPDLDQLPFPARDYLDRLYQEDPGYVRQSWHNISRSRGCYAACTYCSVAAFARLGEGAPWRTRNPQSVIAELRWLRDGYGIRRVRFTDDEFVGFGRKGEASTIEFAEALSAAALDVEFMVSMRVDHATNALLRPLRRAGLEMVLLGVESGSPDDLKLYRKGTTVAKNERGIDAAIECGIDVVLALILFNPWSTLAGVTASLDLLEHHCHPRVIMEPLVLLNKLNPLSGTSIETRFQQAGFDTELFLRRDALPEYPFQDPEVARLYGVCDRHFRKHALRVDIATSEADLALHDLRNNVSARSFQLRAELYRTVRHSLQRSFLDAIRELADSGDPEQDVPMVEERFLDSYRDARRQLRIVTSAPSSPESVSAAVM
jgi:radical SAM superfamily enzyme YgiQ (UPF0313 family)